MHGSTGGTDAHDRAARCTGSILQHVLELRRLEIRKHQLVMKLYCTDLEYILLLLLCGGTYIQKEAHNASEKYKEGKFILELAKTDQLP